MKSSNTAKVRLGGSERGAHQIGGLRIVRRHLARRTLDGEHVADDQLGAFLRIVPDHPFIIGAADILGEDVGDVAPRLGGLQRLVDARDPRQLQRQRIDRRDLDRLRLRGEGRATSSHASASAPAPSASTSRRPIAADETSGSDRDGPRTMFIPPHQSLFRSDGIIRATESALDSTAWSIFSSQKSFNFCGKCSGEAAPSGRRGIANEVQWCGINQSDRPRPPSR